MLPHKLRIAVKDMSAKLLIQFEKSLLIAKIQKPVHDPLYLFFLCYLILQYHSHGGSVLLIRFVTQTINAADRF